VYIRYTVCVCVIEMMVRFALNCFGKNKILPVNTIKAPGRRLSLWCLYLLFTQRLSVEPRSLTLAVGDTRRRGTIHTFSNFSLPCTDVQNTSVFMLDCSLHCMGKYLTQKDDFDFDCQEIHTETSLKLESVAFTLSHLKVHLGPHSFLFYLPSVLEYMRTFTVEINK